MATERVHIDISGHCAAALYEMGDPVFRVLVDGDGARYAWAAGPDLDAVLAAYRDVYRGDWTITAQPAARRPPTDSGPCGLCKWRGTYSH